MDISKLFAPFAPGLVSWRIGSMAKKPDANGKTKGRALAYIDARDVMRRLDDVCGPANWQCRYPHANGKTICEIGIKVDGEWVWKANGAGDTDIEAEKGAISDAFKRAAVLWGIGRYLYDLDSPWVEVNAFKQIEAHEHKRLERILAGARIEMPEEAAAPVFNTAAPAGVNPDLWATAYSRAESGTAAFTAWAQNDATTSEKAMIGPFKGDLWAMAKAADAKAQEAA